MSRDEWKDWYKESIRELREGYRKALKEWRERFRDWKKQARSSISEGFPPPLPPVPHMPPLPPRPPISGGRSNVVASRIGGEELQRIDMLVEAGVFSTRSKAVAYLVSEGIKARQDILDRVSSALGEIRRIRKEAEEEIADLKKEIGLTETEETKERDSAYPNAAKHQSNFL